MSSTTPEVTGIFGPAATSSAPLPPKRSPSTLGPLLPQAPAIGLPGTLATLRGAIVNIVCTSKDSRVRSMSGSGVIFDPKGLILTNSHIGQYYLVRDALPKGTITCTIRTGNPAQTAYRAEPVYVSSQWVAANPRTLVTAGASGTGEHDFAVLAITESATPLPLPGSFPYIALGKGVPVEGAEVALGTYGAQSLSSRQIQNSLFPTLVTAKVRTRFSFDNGQIDLIALTGSAASQQGSSGGAVANASGELIGIITTSTQTGEFSSRETRAVTTAHIRSSFKQDSGEDFDRYFKNGYKADFVDVFTDDSERLGTFLVKQLDR
ncbi:MAG TPA: serine protease [Candidatus Paceibacterota bacterium]|nr:serine protease [Candidatus Paceibacterota bacterium]